MAQINSENDEVLLRMENVIKTFPGVLAVDKVNLEVKRGEIHTLLGENGAGKSTLMNCLYGLYRPDSGKIYFKGQKVEINSAKDSIALGIGMVHQHFMLVPTLTIAENIVLGLHSKRSPLLDLETAEKEIDELCKAYGLKLDPKTPVWQLPVGVQQRVEIVKALYRKADLLILDEPTAVLTPQEVTELFGMLTKLTENGLAIIFITHKLEEVMAVCQRVTVLRNGQVVGTVNKEDTSIPELTRMMVGRPLMLDIHKPSIPCGERVLSVTNLEAKNDKGLAALKNINFEIGRGEILGIAGVDGNGQKELAEALTGLRPVISGSVKILDKNITNCSTSHIRKMNIANIPEDRQKTGLILDFPITENLALNDFEKTPYSKFTVLNYGAIESRSDAIISEFNIKTPENKQHVRLLSGGNQQKVILGRELSQKPDLIVAAQPTRGLDVGATEFVREQLVEQRSRGAAILLISTELDEILALSDRIAVMYEGEILDILPGENADVQKIGLLMAGIRNDLQAVAQ